MVSKQAKVQTLAGLFVFDLIFVAYLFPCLPLTWFWNYATHLVLEVAKLMDTYKNGIIGFYFLK